MRFSSLRFASLLPLFLSGYATFAANTISTRSPFLPTAGAQAAAPEQQGPTNIEWCGIMEMNGERYFGLSETDKERSAWLRINEESRGFIVRNFSDSGPTLTVQFQGQSHALRMKQVTVGALPAGAFPVAARPPGMRPPGSNPNDPSQVSDPDQEKRLSAVAAEVRRRREMRAAAAASEGQRPQQSQPSQ